jgi:hypothetical protein
MKKIWVMMKKKKRKKIDFEELRKCFREEFVE